MRQTNCTFWRIKHILYFNKVFQKILKQHLISQIQISLHGQFCTTNLSSQAHPRHCRSSVHRPNCSTCWRSRGSLGCRMQVWLEPVVVGKGGNPRPRKDQGCSFWSASLWKSSVDLHCNWQADRRWTVYVASPSSSFARPSRTPRWWPGKRYQRWQLWENELQTFN